MPLPPVKKQKTLACIREIQVHKLWTKVYSQKGLTTLPLCCLTEGDVSKVLVGTLAFCLLLCTFLSPQCSLIEEGLHKVLGGTYAICVLLCNFLSPLCSRTEEGVSKVLGRTYAISIVLCTFLLPSSSASMSCCNHEAIL